MENSVEKTEKILEPCWRSFIVYYLAIGLCILGPHLNPQFSHQLGLTPNRGLIIGLILLLGVGYLKWNQEYRISSQGVKKLGRIPAREEEMTWAEVDQVEVRRGLTQTLLNVGNIIIKPVSPVGKQMVFYGIDNPKQIKNLIDRWRS